jgi:hypothetical protein
MGRLRGFDRLKDRAGIRAKGPQPLKGIGPPIATNRERSTIRLSVQCTNADILGLANMPITPSVSTSKSHPVR